VTTLSDRKGDYGFDAPNVLLTLTGIGLVWLVIAVVLAAFHVGFWALAASISLVVLLGAASFTYTTRRGKFVIWAEILEGLQLRGDERVLDMGSGRGAVQLMAAQMVPRGQAVGLDLWRATDQSGNAADVAKRNAQSEGVAGNTAFETGDMSKMPFPDNSFDLVVSSLAIHNIEDAATRQRAIDEAVRVIKPGGRLAIADFVATSGYAKRLGELGMAGVTRRNLGWRFWYGFPWTATSLVTATKPKAG
jgi:arsenite methyltransferase